MSAKYAIREEFMPLSRFSLPKRDWPLRVLNALMATQRRFARWDLRLSRRWHVASDPGGGRRAVRVLEISPESLSGWPAPALLYCHGGAFFMTYADGHLQNAQRYALDASCRVFLVDYRLSLDAPFPAALDDCHTALAWLSSTAGALGVDAGRIALMGGSAGGALAASLAQRACDDGGPPLCGQSLVYPVTDCDAKTESANAFTDTPVWNADGNRRMWRIYLRGHGEEPPRYASPLHRKDFAGLPRAYVETAEFDPLRDEGRLYAQALERAGVAVTLRETEGTVHGYDMIAASEITAESMRARAAALRGFFEEPDARAAAEPEREQAAAPGRLG